MRGDDLRRLLDKEPSLAFMDADGIRRKRRNSEYAGVLRRAQRFVQRIRKEGHREYPTLSD